MAGGGWGQAIATTAGGVGNDFGRATDANVDTALKVIQQKLMMQEVQQRLREGDQRMQLNAAPQTALIPTPQGGTSSVSTNPLTGQMSPPQTVIPGMALPPKDPKQLLAEAMQANDFQKAQQIVDTMGKEYQAEHPSPKPPKWELKQDDKGNWTWIPGEPGAGKPTPTGVRGKMPKGAAGSGAGGGGGDSVANWATEIANGGAWSEVPAKLKTPVNNYMKAHGMLQKKKLSAMEERQQGAINTMEPMIEDLENTLTQSGLVNPKDPSKSNNSPIASHLEWIKYNTLKMAPEGVRGDIIRQSAALQVLGAAPWMTIGRSKYLYENIIKHLPAPQDSPKLLWDKTQFLKRLIADQQGSLDKAQGGSMGDTSVAPDTGAPPPGAKVRDFTQVGSH